MKRVLAVCLSYLSFGMAPFAAATTQGEATIIDVDRGGLDRDHVYRCYDYRHSYELVWMLYNAALFRDPEPGGSDGWVDNIARHGYRGLLDDGRIADSPEFRYDVRYNHSDYEIIDNMYWVLLGREPDWEGAHYWLNILRQGRGGDVLRGLVASDEFYYRHLYGCPR